MHLIFSVKTFFQLIMLSSFLFIVPDVSAAEKRSTIAVVDVRLLLQTAPQTAEATRILKERFIPQEKELEDEALAIKNLEERLVRDKAKLSKEERITRERDLRQRKRERNRALEDYREDVRLERAAALDEVQRQVLDAIESVRASKNIDVVIQDYVAASPEVDITNDVLALLGKLLKDSQRPTIEGAAN
ncbi:MAG: Unknown protein [uncultured Thiotrichaceae bacterium]|uniref:OmpH family outer membrane protein n=1 Tax=uncultured Thiotrichaceae bacterium TaxID=298394 RepID=A0A6S6SKF0_9GAMM|nr:MAG: Unknown protein [uncultured Thiotrichaceae bacterium]